ncbi:MAG TPA: glycosyl hydrolase family 65 protein [Thermotogota bacterium]|nr:glycosyl hydrolase family 65 protein [Thermotogota bacterium]
MQDPLWTIEETTFDRSRSTVWETLFTLANGYRGLRGWMEFSEAGTPGNFVAGVFDKWSAPVSELVNAPNPLGFSLYFLHSGGMEPVNLDSCILEGFSRTLCLKTGLLEQHLVLRTPLGKMVHIDAERFVSRANVHRWATRYRLTARNDSGHFVVVSHIDANVQNGTKDPYFCTMHLHNVHVCDLQPGIALSAMTRDHDLQIAEAVVLLPDETRHDGLKRRFFNDLGQQVSETYTVPGSEGNPVTLYRMGTTMSARDPESESVGVMEALKKESALFLQEGFDNEKQAHIQAMQRLWHDIDIQIQGDPRAQLAIRFNLFHLANCAGQEDSRVSIAAKGLHGEGYKGHVFWDTELFMLPFFIYTQPNTARNLLLYRYHTLDGARQNAKKDGFEGARFAWESAQKGDEVTPRWGVNYKGEPVRIWTGDEEFHISGDVAMAVFHYFRATGDEEFMRGYGVEILLQTARFWLSRLEWNEEFSRFEIRKVIGPDEFHEHVDNNVYTNFLASWNLKEGARWGRWLKQKDPVQFERLMVLTGLSEDKLVQWESAAQQIFIPVDSQTGVIEQFEGYFDLQEWPITQHDENGMPLWPVGLDLGELDRTRLVKQPDVLMLMYLIPEEFSMETRKVNYDFYEQRTMHKSSLSPCIHAFLGLGVGDRRNAYRYYLKTVETDLKNNQGNTAHGLHAASAGGGWLSSVLGFGGFSVSRDQVPRFDPWIPEHWKRFCFQVYWRSNPIRVEVDSRCVRVKTRTAQSLQVYSHAVQTRPGEWLEIPRPKEEE